MDIYLLNNKSYSVLQLISQYVKELGSMCKFANVKICKSDDRPVDVLIANQ